MGWDSTPASHVRVGNVTGLSYSVGMETVSKSLEPLKTTVPSVRRVAVLSNPGNSGHALAVRTLQAAAQYPFVRPFLQGLKELGWQ